MSKMFFKEIKVFQTEYNVHRKICTDDYGKYCKYFIAYTININQKELRQSVYFMPLRENSERYNLVNAIFNKNDFHKLEIVKTVKTIYDDNSEQKSVFYNARISAISDEGAPICCDFELDDYRNYDSQFKNFISLLRFKKIIE